MKENIEHVNSLNTISKLEELGFEGSDGCIEVSLKEYGLDITIYDPWANSDEVLHEYNLKSIKSLPKQKFDAIVLTVAHNEFKDLDLESLSNLKSVVYDVKNFLPNNKKDKGL